jgi:hypothetical protein
VIDEGTASWTAGTTGMLKAPLAMTTVSHLQSPRFVTTRYPSPSGLTDVTVIPASTGAETALA